MTNDILTTEEKEEFNVILDDLKFVFSKAEIHWKEIKEVLSRLKSEEVKSYIKSLIRGSKPEAALTEALFAGRSVLSKYLFKDKAPQVNIGVGFVDYLVETRNGKYLILELKPPLEGQFKTGKGKKRVLTKLRQTELTWGDHKEQILKYIREKTDFIILTNLRNWVFFNKDCSPAHFEPFFNTDLSQFYEEYGVFEDLSEYLERKDFESVREELDKRFFADLKMWVNQLSKTEFKSGIDKKRKSELIIDLINKFIFIQTLDDCGAIDFRWTKTAWDYAEQRWGRKGKLLVLQEFFREVNEWFYKFYDTELFRENILDYIENNDENIDSFYGTLQQVLGLAYWQTILGFKGIMQYNFRLIDEDILGKAYETYLAEIRKEQGIFYTPRYITEYIVDNTVGTTSNELLHEIKKEINAENFEKATELMNRFISIKVLDPACGSGSFLIKALRVMWKRYKELEETIGIKQKEYRNQYKGLFPPKHLQSKVESLRRLKEISRVGNDRELVSAIILRHIYGNDLDKKALDVAKVNIWLEGIKRAPKAFRYDTLPRETNYILPDLEMNLGNGDSLVGLPESIAIKILSEKHEEDVKKLSELRNKYLDNPTSPELVQKIEGVKSGLRKELDKEFGKYLEENDLPLNLSTDTKAFHWPLEFWYVFFDKNGEIKEKEHQGFDTVIGNPPYVRIQILNRSIPDYVELLSSQFNSAYKNYDLAVIFTEKGYSLLKHGGRFSYIETKKWLNADYGEKLRKILSREKCVEELVDFGDQQVFKEATTYTALLFLRKEKLKELKYALVNRLEGTLEQLYKVRDNNELIASGLCVSTIPSEELTPRNWVFAISEEKKIIEKINKERTLSELRDRIFQGLVTGADKVFILELREDREDFVGVYSKSKDREYLLEKALLKPLLKGEEIKRWAVERYHYVVLYPYNLKITESERKAALMTSSELQKYPKIWQYLLDNKTELEARENGKWKGVKNWYAYGRRQNMEQFEQPKIMTQVLANKASFALDNDGLLYFVGGGNAGGYGITLKKGVGIELKYLLGLLNGTLLDWYLKKISSRFRGGYYSYAKRYIEKLPICKADKKEQSRIAKLVEKITILKKLEYEFREIWKHYSEKYRSGCRPLGEILLIDKKKIQQGNFDEVWVSEANVYPDEDNELLRKEFKEFSVVGEENKKLKIYGISGSKEDLLLDMSAKDRDIRDIIYLEILGLLSSRAKVGTLKDIFSKSRISVVQPNIWEKSRNLVRGATKKFEEWLEKQNFQIKEKDIVKISNEMKEADSQINALVFKLYKLTEDEVRVVLNSLKTPTSFQQKVFSYFEA